MKNASCYVKTRAYRGLPKTAPLQKERTEGDCPQCALLCIFSFYLF